MPRRKLPPTAQWAQSPDDVEAAYYEALLTGNVDAVMALWSEHDDISCVHPGGQRLDGQAAIRDSFAQIVSEGVLKISAETQRRWTGVSHAIHTVVERVQVGADEDPEWGFVLATNVFILTAGGWRLVLHHASQGTPHAALDALVPGEVLH